jgi:hypothetical protein
MRRKKSNGIWKVVAISLALISVMGLFTLIYIAATEEQVQIGRAFCPTTGREDLITENVTFLFDSTESLAASQAEYRRNILSREILGENKLDGFKRFIFYELNSIEDSAVNKLQIIQGDADLNYFCIPPEISSESENNKKAREGFIRDLAVVVERNIDSTPQEYSPIIDALRFIGASQVGSAYQKNRLIIVSDMIENSKTISMYRDNWFSSSYQNNKRNILQQRPVFPEDTQIEIYLLAMPKYNLEPVEISQFWLSFLTEDGQQRRIPSPIINFVSGGL